MSVFALLAAVDLERLRSWQRKESGKRKGAGRAKPNRSEATGQGSIIAQNHPSTRAAVRHGNSRAVPLSVGKVLKAARDKSCFKSQPKLWVRSEG